MNSLPPGRRPPGPRWYTEPNPWLLPMWAAAGAGAVISIAVTVATGTLWGTFGYLPLAAVLFRLFRWSALSSRAFNDDIRQREAELDRRRAQWHDERAFREYVLRHMN